MAIPMVTMWTVWWGGGVVSSAPANTILRRPKRGYHDPSKPPVFSKPIPTSQHIIHPISQKPETSKGMPEKLSTGSVKFSQVEHHLSAVAKLWAQSESEQRPLANYTSLP